MSINVTARKHFRSKDHAGEFDVDLRVWARDAKAFGSPILIEWGRTNGNWFSWNGKWNGGAIEGPKRYMRLIAILSIHAREGRTI